MSQVRNVYLEITNPQGRTVGSLEISILPRHRYAQGFPLWDFRDTSINENSMEPVQVLEGEEYKYEIHTDILGVFSTDRQELFEPDDDTGRRGRLKPGLHTGGLPIQLFVNSQLLGEVALEVRSRKLDYSLHYRWMLRDIASFVAEIVTQYFAPTLQQFKPDESRDAETLYQQFAFLYAFITSANFETAISQIVSSPHRTWMELDAVSSPSAGIRGNSRLLREILRPGPRQSWPESPVSGLNSLPIHISVTHRVESVDTPENRFIKFALQYWRNLTTHVGQILQTSKKNYSVERGLREVGEVLDLLDFTLSHDFFRAINAMTFFPTTSSVVNRKEGYIEIFQAYLQTEIAANLAWKGADDIYGAGQRDVATLYEFWAFLQISRVVAQLCNLNPLNLRDILELTPNGLNLRLQRGKKLVLTGSTNVFNRQLDISLFYNRTFSTRFTSFSDGSWSRPMRPDYSLRISINPQTGTVGYDVIWLHFDAKYKIDTLSELFGAMPFDGTDEEAYLDDEHETTARGKYRRADLLTMHAYRDAVRRSSGAYILYPGTELETLTTYQEILPGIGAFPMRPTDTEMVDGSATLTAFLNDVIYHLSRQPTLHERARYWQRTVYNEHVSDAAKSFHLLLKPPSDTKVFVTNINSPSVYDWTISEGAVILGRKQSSAKTLGVGLQDLAIDYVLFLNSQDKPVLWSVIGDIKLLTEHELSDRGYPENPDSDLFLVFFLKETPIPLSIFSPSLEGWELFLQRLSSEQIQLPIVVILSELLKLQ